MYRIVDLIIKKRDGYELSKDEINYIINGYVKEDIPDYQISALLMAIFYKGLSQEETYAFTEAMLKSGDIIDLSNIKGIKVDKHSTGGVGDKTSLVVGPIVAALGIKIAKMSGRGLGHTGGTLDKLEAIPGFRIEISGERFIEQVNEIGIALIGQSADITPADKKLYALRDVTGTVESIGLIASSIMSKKLASGADYIVLDVKVGQGAFMKNVDEAKKLASLMVDIGLNAKRQTVATLTDMNQPLGNAVGNSIEVIEAIETLKGNGPEDFTELCKVLSAEILTVSKVASNNDEAFRMINEVISNKKALNKFAEMIEAQGGNPEIINDYSLLPQAQEEIELFYNEEQVCYVHEIDALKIGEAAMLLGAGRATKEDKIDHGVGIIVNKKIGDEVKKGDVIAKILTNGKNTNEAIACILSSFMLSNEKINRRPIILDIVR